MFTRRVVLAFLIGWVVSIFTTVIMALWNIRLYGPNPYVLLPLNLYLYNALPYILGIVSAIASYFVLMSFGWPKDPVKNGKWVYIGLGLLAFFIVRTILGIVGALALQVIYRYPEFFSVTNAPHLQIVLLLVSLIALVPSILAMWVALHFYLRDYPVSNIDQEHI